MIPLLSPSPPFHALITLYLYHPTCPTFLHPLLSQPCPSHPFNLLNLYPLLAYLSHPLSFSPTTNLVNVGGMQALEWALLGGEDNYVESAVSIGNLAEPTIANLT